MGLNGRRGLKMVRRIVLIVAMLTFTSSAAYAVNLNGYKLIPSLTAKQAYTDNYFLVNTDVAGTVADKVWVTTFTPDIRLEVGQTTKFYLDFRSDLIAVEEFSQENRQNQFYTAGFEYKPGKNLSFKIENVLSDVRDQGGTRPVPGEFERTTRVENALSSTLTYKFTEKLGTEFIVGWTNFDFDIINEQLTRHEYNLTIRGTYFVSPRTEAFVGYRYSDMVFTGLKFVLPDPSGRTATQLDMDNQGHTLQVGLRFHQLPVGGGKLQGEIWGGYQRVDFEVQEDLDEFALSGRLTYLPTPRTTVVFLTSREQTASPLISGDAAINTSVRLDVIYRFFEKFAASLGGSFRNSDYIEPEAIRGTPLRAERNDDTVTFRAGLDYSFYKYFKAGISYEFTDKSVDPVELRDREYQQNVVAFTLNGTF